LARVPKNSKTELPEKNTPISGLKQRHQKRGTGKALIDVNLALRRYFIQEKFPVSPIRKICALCEDDNG
jgi:hypothetical protein